MQQTFASDAFLETKVLPTTLHCSRLRRGGCGLGGVTFLLQRQGGCELYAVKTFSRKVASNICAKAAFADVRA